MLLFCSIESHLSQHFHTKYVTDPVHSIVHSQCNGGKHGVGYAGALLVLVYMWACVSHKHLLVFEWKDVILRVRWPIEHPLSSQQAYLLSLHLSFFAPSSSIYPPSP